MGIPVVIAENGFGLPVVDATAGGLGMPMTVAENGYGTPVVIAENGFGVPAVFDPPLAPLGPDETAPTITSSASVSNTENTTLAHTLTAIEVRSPPVTWTKTGGADAAKFTLTGNVLSWASGTKNFEAPDDADANNTYIVEITATDTALNASSQTITVTVADTGDPTPSLSPTLDFDFVANTSIIAGASSTAVAPITVTRNIAAWADNVAGVWSSFAINAARITDKGLLLEEPRTNVCLQSRTLTNASWVKTNCTALKDQTGIDGVASSASRITATAANATCLLTTTVTSSARWQTAFVKRLVGTGNIQMTQNNGTTWTTVTTTGSWTRVECPTVTAANPVVGFRIVTSGDSVAIDMVQNENGAYATSPIPTTTASVTRTADVVIINTTVAPLASWFVAATGTLFAEGVPHAGSLPTPIVFQLDNASTSLHYVGLPGATAAAGGTTTAGSAVGTFNGTYAAGVNKAAWAYAVNDMAGSHNGAAVVTDATGPTMPTGITTARLGKIVAATHWSGYLRRLVYFNTRVPNATLVTLTSGAPATITAPAVTGTTHVLQTLTSTSGLWTGSPTGYTYQWYRVT